jgi:hypothetical protein
MKRLVLAALACSLLTAASAHAGGLTGRYLEARTTDVWTGPCFANADSNLAGKNAVLAWKVDKGGLDDVSLAGLAVVAVVQASDTLGLKQTGTARAVLLVDSRASKSQQEALVRLAKRQGGDLLRNVVAVQQTAIDFDAGNCKEGGCARLDAGVAQVATRCIDHRVDKACGNETAFYPPLARDLVTSQPAVATEHSFTGKGLKEVWKDGERRGAYVGTFEIR